MKNILIIEDDYDAANLISLIFESSEYTVMHVDEGGKGLNALTSRDFDLILLDITLPDTNGFKVCKEIRSRGLDTPIIMLTSHTKEADKVLALDLGADDYVTKPVPVLEFKSRVKALLRRSCHSSPQSLCTIINGPLELNLEKRTVTLLQKRIDLTLTEFNLLALLAANPGKVYSRAELLKEVWGQSHEGYQQTVTTHISRLRIKIETDFTNPALILTSWGVGYYFADSPGRQ